MKLFYTFLFVVFAGVLFAQQISVFSFERRDNDLDARVNYPVKDQNNDVCAMIKIETTQTGFVFEGGQLGIIKTERKTGEYWVYIPWGSKKITIKHDQLGILRDYLFPESIDKATVYLMKLTTGKVTVVVEEPEILTQWVVITSTPDGAQVYVDDKPVGNTPFSREYSLGQHQYRVEMPMYHADAGIFTLDGVSDKVRVNSALKPNFGSIFVSSTPESDADVLLDGKPTGQKTPCTLTEILSGNHRITIKKTMYYDAWQEVTVEDGKTTNVSLSMNPAYGELSITTNPSSDIYIDDVKIGSGTYSVRKSSGFYTVEARKEKHTPDSKKVEVTDGKTIPVALAPVPQYGTLKISSTPPDAEIYIDGVKKGTTPTTIRQLLVGEYKLELRKTSYASITKNITILHNETTEISETLQNGMQVSITSTPVGATLEIDGTTVGSTPYTGMLTFGSHSLKLSNNTKVITETIDVTQGGKLRWNFVESESTPVSIISTPVGASLVIDGVNAGTTPFSGTLTLGRHSLQLSNNSRVVNDTISVIKGGKTSWSYDVKEVTQISITSTPSGVSLEIDGEHAGTTPYTGMLGFGGHTLILTNKTKVVKESISVLKGSRTNWSFDLTIRGNSFIDTRDGKTYETIIIKDQEWLSENLNYFTSSGSWCYDDNSSNCNKYGRLYNWETAKKVCPAGWHLPSKSEFETLRYNVGPSGSDAYNALTSTGSSGFSARFGGTRYGGGGTTGLGEYGEFWSSSPHGSLEAWNFSVSTHSKIATMASHSISFGNSVRCIKD